MRNLKSKYRALIKFVLAGGLIFYAISGINSLLNYALYPVLSRFLSIEDYGESQFLLSAFNQLSVGFVVLNILAIIIAASIKNKLQQDRRIASLNAVASSVAIVIALIGGFVLLGFSDSLNISSDTAIVLLCLSLLLNVPFTILVGQLQGNGKFIVSGVVSFIATLCKLGFSALFAALGFGISGVMAGLALGTLAAILLGTGYTKGLERPRLKLIAPGHIKNLSLVRAQAAVGLISVGAITVLSTIDSIASRAILSSTDAGLYAAVATLSKIILAATAPLLWLSLPHVVDGHYKIVWKYIAVTALVSVVITGFFSLNPSGIIQASLSIDAAAYSNLLILASISMSIYAVGLIATAVLLCERKPFSVIAIYSATLITALALAAASTMYAPPTVHQVIVGQIILGLVIMMPSILTLAIKSRKYI